MSKRNNQENKQITDMQSTPPGAPGNRENATTTASSISTTNDSKLQADNTHMHTNTNTNAFSLPAIKMSEKLLNSIGNKTNVVIVRRPKEPAPVPNFPMPTDEISGPETSNRLSVFPCNTDCSFT